MINRVLLSVAVCLVLGGESLMAHDPHDPIITVAASPNFAQDSTAFATTDYLSIKPGVYALLKSTDAGLTWSTVPGLPNVNKMVAVVFSPAYTQDQTIFVAGSGGLFQSIDQGASWTLSSNLALQNVAVSPNFSADNTLFIITTQKTIFISTNRGQTFTQLASPSSLTSNLNVVAVSPNFDVDHTVLLGSASNGVFKSTNGGTSWVQVNATQPFPAINGLTFSPGFTSDKTVFAATGSGFMISKNGGSSWAISDTGLSDTSVNSITLSPGYLQDSTLWVATAVGGIFQSTNQGVSWSVLPLINRVLSPITTSHYHNVAAGSTGSGTALILATFEGLWTSPSSPISWLYVDIIPTRLIRHLLISPNYANDKTVFGNTYGGGNLWTTTGGSSWSFKNTGMQLPYTDVADISTNFKNDQTAFSGTGTVLQRTTDGGATWQAMTALGVITHPRGMAASPAIAQDGTVLIGTDNEPGLTYPPFVTYMGQQYPNQGLFISLDRGDNWIPTSLGGPAINSISISPGFLSDRTAFATSPLSGLFKSTDGGMNWTQVVLPGNPLKLGLVAVSPAFATDLTVFVAPITGGLLKSVDGGSTWVVLPRTTNLMVLDVQLSPNYAVDQTFFVGTIQAGVMKSTNGGTSLIPQTGFPDDFAMALAISPNYTQDHTLFAAAYHSVFKSTDGGSTWRDTVEPARIEESRTVDSNTSGQPPPTISYQGSWSPTSSSSASTNAYMTTTTVQNTAVLNFTGTGIRWVSRTGPGQGSATILLDGVSKGTVTLTATTDQYQQTVWQQHGLACTPHTFTITATPQSGKSVTLDAFDIWINACPEASQAMHHH